MFEEKVRRLTRKIGGYRPLLQAEGFLDECVVKAWADKRDRRSSGLALIVALAALAVMMILLLALLDGATGQMNDARQDVAAAQEKMLADSAVALVTGQIRQASTQTNVAWISQPGLLRTYAVSATRRPMACYKLYSTSSLTNLVDTSGTLAFLSNDVPANWNSAAQANAYTDLNAPTQTATSPSGTVYPILEPAALTNIVGVSVDSGHAVEMPVAWLYQLRDGTLGPAANGTKANPIVARMAFWTDDETSKVDINTAGCGTGWNTPHANSTDDVAWSTNQPAAGEYSSYPGHPAATSLAPVFGATNGALSPQQLLGLTPRYGWGGSQFGTTVTTPGEVVPPKTDRLYASVDELCFGSQISSGQRQKNPPTASQVEVARFVLTSHSQAPETTLLGEPRIAIWPVSDAPQDSTRTTATDRAIASAATVGARAYFFQRHNALSSTDDLATNVVPSNGHLFSDLVARGAVNQPGYGTALAQKYPGAEWTQIALEIVDFIRGLNAVDPSPAPFVPYAAANTSGIGRGFIVPLTTTYGTGVSRITLRGLGRCPTLSSLTLVFYVSGFVLKSGGVTTTIDFDGMANAQAVATWNTNFLPGSGQWKNVTGELVRCFVVPCTFHPGCAYPEVSDACSLQIQGLNQISVSSGGNSGNFGFAASATSLLLGTPPQTLAPDRAWGGNDGPVTWRMTGDTLAGGGSATYPFAGTSALVVPMTTMSASLLDPKQGGVNWPPTSTFAFAAVNGVTVLVRDGGGNTLQTLTVNFPAFTIRAPTISGECDHADGSTPATADTTWATDTSAKVAPCYYMSLQNRLLATQNSRAVLIQAGDISRSIEAATDLRVIAALPSVPASMFQPHPGYSLNQVNAQNGSPAHNLRFADGTSACFAPGVTTMGNTVLAKASYGLTRLVLSAPYASSFAPLITVTDWRDGSTQVPYDQFINPPCSVPTNTNYVTMLPTQNIYGDWDTGPGLASDGAQDNLPDAGTTLAPAAAYRSLAGGQPGAATQRTPNALVPSPVIFGSLPAGINPAQPALSEPWRTLLFCPYPAADAGHPGFVSPPDHLVLDNFWMPTVEPYAISGCMTTAGKINLNDQIAPFTWIHRSTALHALLADQRIPAIPATLAGSYKSAGTPIATIWKAVDENATIAQIENRFAGASVDAYLSESEICTVPLVPAGQAPASVALMQTALDTFWSSSSGGLLTGDNLRELPYAQLYSRLTTRSNSYTVHVRVQVLQKRVNDPQQNVWNEGVDRVLGDWRGSYEIERYLDPAAVAPAAGTALGPYKFRIVSSRQFAP